MYLFRSLVVLLFLIAAQGAWAQVPQKAQPTISSGENTKKKGKLLPQLDPKRPAQAPPSVDEVRRELQEARPSGDQTNRPSPTAEPSMDASEQEKRHVENIKNNFALYRQTISKVNRELDKIEPILIDIATLDRVTGTLQSFLTNCKEAERAETRTILRLEQAQNRKGSRTIGSIEAEQVADLQQRLVEDARLKADCYVRLAQTRDAHKQALVVALQRRQQIDFIFANAKEDKERLDRISTALDNEFALLEVARVQGRSKQNSQSQSQSQSQPQPQPQPQPQSQSQPQQQQPKTNIQ